jgi:hypothetical protein
MTDFNKQEIFEYLDAVRESGLVNMFSGAKLLQQNYGMNYYFARDLCVEWMQTFAERHDAKASVAE